MTIFKGPEAGINFNVKFVRLGRGIYVGDTLADNHMEITLKGNILNESDRVRVRRSLEVDAGFVKLDWEERRISVGGESLSLQLPIYRVREEARAVTIVDFSRKSPGFSVEKMDKETVDAYYK